MSQDSNPLPLLMTSGAIAFLCASGLSILIGQTETEKLGSSSGGGSGIGRSKMGNPEAKIDAGLETLRERKRSEWRAKDHPEGLIERALDWAEGYTLGIAEKITTDPTLKARIEQELYPRALDMADKWIRGFTEFLK